MELGVELPLVRRFEPQRQQSVYGCVYVTLYELSSVHFPLQSRGGVVS